MADNTGERPVALQFLRNASLPGVELVDVQFTSQNWQCYATGFDLVVPRTWRADFAYQRKGFQVAEGAVFCAEPGELFRTTGIHNAGDVGVLCLPREGVLEHFNERSGGDGLDFGASLRTIIANGPLQRNVEHLRALLHAPADALQLQTAYYDVIDTLITHFERATLPPVVSNLKDDVTARRVREWLDEEPSRRVDLYALAQETGRSRYQVLRAFKRRYGLPPHAYQLCVRIARAQSDLLQGDSPAQVAVRYGFVDQSHFSKHFKRLVGVTPATYAKRPSRARSREAPHLRLA